MKPNPGLESKMRQQGYVAIPLLCQSTGLSRTPISVAISDNRIRSKRVGSRVFVRLEDFAREWPDLADMVGDL